MTYTVRTFGRDCLGNVTGYRVVDENGVTQRQFVCDIYEQGSFARSKAAAAYLAEKLNCAENVRK